ncbi:MAG: hypothetical protein HYX94_07240 [Chloroflexi bacterium]|nr:hypothetical protein [Chloroflexota bacterium]
MTRSKTTLHRCHRTILSVADESTKVAMLKTGELDVAPVAPDSISGLKLAGVKVQSYDADNQMYGIILFDIDNPQSYDLGNVKVRQALHWSINRKEMIDKLLGGLGGTFPLVAASSSANFFDANVKPDPYDPEGAKKLLAEGGYPKGFNTRIWVHGGFQSTISTALSGYWQKIGVNAELVPIELAALYTLYMPKHKPEVWNSVRISTLTSGSDFAYFAPWYTSTGAHKNTKNARIDELAVKIPQVASADERLRLTKEFTSLAYSEHTILRVVSFHTNVGLGSKVGQMTPKLAPVILGPQLETLTHAK